MKTRLLPPLLALCALGLSSTLTAAADHTAVPGGRIPVQTIRARVPANGDTVTAGDGRIMVQLRLGQPSGRLPDGSWVYRDYAADLGGGRTATGHLVIRFDRGRVAALSLADNATLAALRLEPRPGSQPALLAANPR